MSNHVWYHIVKFEQTEKDNQIFWKQTKTKQNKNTQNNNENKQKNNRDKTEMMHRGNNFKNISIFWERIGNISFMNQWLDDIKRTFRELNVTIIIKTVWGYVKNHKSSTCVTKVGLRVWPIIQLDLGHKKGAICSIIGAGEYTSIGAHWKVPWGRRGVQWAIKSIYCCDR